MACKQESLVFCPTANFTDNIWSDHLHFFSANDLVFDSLTKEIDPLKEKVKEMLMGSTAEPLENVKFINLLLRLVVSYHFNNDIETQLERLFHSQQNDICRSDLDLDSTSIVFRVFRQHGFKISCDVFDKFKDCDGKFKETVIGDVRGMLSLYEAAFLRVHGESTLEEALTFTKANLESLAMKSSPHLAKQIINALDQPMNKCPPRLDARNYISFYEMEDSRNESLLQFAKLDFNRLQVLYQQEISHIVSIECYMKQHNMLEEEALEELKKIVENAWKDVNEECMKPTPVPRDLLLLPLNFVRATNLFYKHGDGYTNPAYVKEDIQMLFLDQIPI